VEEFVAMLGGFLDETPAVLLRDSLRPGFPPLSRLSLPLVGTPVFFLSMFFFAWY